jgi:UDP-N-acetylmuramate dehydrogenase
MLKFKENVPLAKFTNYKIGGPARFFFEAKDEAELRWAIETATAKKLPIFILGGGTNLLIGDKGFKGLVLKPAIMGIERKGNTVTVGSGVLVSHLLIQLNEQMLSGFEWAGGLPGTVGGAVRGNAGCFGGETKDSVVFVSSFDMKKMGIIKRDAKACQFSYRTSIFKKKAGREIILSVQLRFKKGNAEKIKKAVEEKIAFRKERHPLEYPSAGSVFKNIPVSEIYKKGSVAYRKALKEGSLEYRGSHFSVKTDPVPVIAAAKLISEAGLKGKRIGGAMISPKHTNFIVNIDNAKAVDVLRLIALVKKKVFAKFGVRMEEEIQIVLS